MSQASALEPEKSWLPFPQPKNPRNGSLTSLIIVISHQKCFKWCCLKACDANFWSCECPEHQPWNLKKVGFPSLSPRNQKNGSLTSLIIVISHQKCCKWRWLKVCDANFWSCECPKHQPCNLKKVGFPSLSPRTQNNGSLTSRIFVISHQKVASGVG